MKIIPAINCNDYETALSRIRTAAAFVDRDYPWVHIDVVDGKFAPVTTWGNPEDLKKLAGQFLELRFEIHLMVHHPESVAGEWLASGAGRLIVHAESQGDPLAVKTACDMRKKECVLSMGPGTQPENIAIIEKFDFFQVLAVNPGFAGQKFSEDSLKKIRFLRAERPDARIEVDGGMNPETAKLAKEAGADVLVAASYIFASPDPAKAYKELLDL